MDSLLKSTQAEAPLNPVLIGIIDGTQLRVPFLSEYREDIDFFPRGKASIRIHGFFQGRVSFLL